MSDLFESARTELGQLNPRRTGGGRKKSAVETRAAAGEIQGIDARIDAIAAELAETRAATRRLVELANRLIDDNRRLRQAAERGTVGRPLKANPVQIAEAQALRQAGRSLREIGAETGLTLRTVRTIVRRARDKAALAADFDESEQHEPRRARR